MLLIIAASLIIVTPMVFSKKVDRLPMPVSGILPPEKWGTGDRYLLGDYITEDEVEKIRKKLNSVKSKF